MAKVGRSFRLDESVIIKIEKIQEHVQTRFNYAAEISMTKAKQAYATDAVEFAVNYAFDILQKQGDIKDLK